MKYDTLSTQYQRQTPPQPTTMKRSSLHRTASVRTTSLVSLLTNSDSEQSTSTAKRRNVLSSEPAVESQPGAMVSSSDESLLGSLHRLSLATATSSSPMDDSTKSDDSDWGHFCKVEEGHAKPAEPPEKPVVVRRKLSIFEQLQQRNKKKTSAMGWSSVPL